MTKSKINAVEWPDFSRIRGYENEIDRLTAMAAAIRDIKDARLESLPRGLLFSGDPGTGKTTLAKAFVMATGLPVFAPPENSGTDGLRLVYQQAEKEAPSVVFIDDVDRVVSIYGPDGYISDESRACLQILLGRLDGVVGGPGVITVMTTNDYYGLDDAMKRSGRVDLHLPIDRPNDHDRYEILKYYMQSYSELFVEGEDPDTLAASVAKKACGLTCADLKLLVKNVYLLNYAKVKAGQPVDLHSSFHLGVMELISGGLLKQDIKNAEEKKRLCYHEAGHAIVEYVLTGKSSDICCLQTANSDTGGWSKARMDDFSKSFHTKEDCINEMAACLGGMAAEKIVLGNTSTSISGDLRYARDVCRMALYCCLGDSRYGRVPCFEDIPLLLPSGSMGYGLADDHQSQDYVAAVQSKQFDFFSEGYRLAEKHLKASLQGLHEIAKILIDEGTMSAERVEKILLENGVTPVGIAIAPIDKGIAMTEAKKEENK